MAGVRSAASRISAPVGQGSPITTGSRSTRTRYRRPGRAHAALGAGLDVHGNVGLDDHLGVTRASSNRLDGGEHAGLVGVSGAGGDGLARRLLERPVDPTVVVGEHLELRFGHTLGRVGQRPVVRRRVAGSAAEDVEAREGVAELGVGLAARREDQPVGVAELPVVAALGGLEHMEGKGGHMAWGA